MNNTGQTIWVGATASSDGSADVGSLPTLDNGQSATISIPEQGGAGHWRGSFFAREGCSGDSGGSFHCEIGDCGSISDRCASGHQPVSLAEFNFDPSDSGAPWYDVSYVDAVSVPVTIDPVNAAASTGSDCGSAGCAVPLLDACPAADLQHGAAGEATICLNPNRDSVTDYSNAIASRCPLAYAWSKQDGEAGNQVTHHCTACSGFTVAFHSN